MILFPENNKYNYDYKIIYSLKFEQDRTRPVKYRHSRSKLNFASQICFQTRKLLSKTLQDATAIKFDMLSNFILWHKKYIEQRRSSEQSSVINWNFKERRSFLYIQRSHFNHLPWIFILQIFNSALGYGNAVIRVFMSFRYGRIQRLAVVYFFFYVVHGGYFSLMDLREYFFNYASAQIFIWYLPADFAAIEHSIWIIVEGLWGNRIRSFLFPEFIRGIFQVIAIKM